uniref:Uncharacterized protein n=1 Tax=Myoviridae sp. ctuID12 TaxID=2826707 RepID=A0A8S5QKF0_9CAUD|nr:MAG TPA: hypothetical protein [Myoviridae sp. ctuID12]
MLGFEKGALSRDRPGAPMFYNRSLSVILV